MTDKWKRHLSPLNFSSRNLFIFNFQLISMSSTHWHSSRYRSANIDDRIGGSDHRTATVISHLSLISFQFRYKYVWKWTKTIMKIFKRNGKAFVCFHRNFHFPLEFTERNGISQFVKVHKQFFLSLLLFLFDSSFKFFYVCARCTPSHSIMPYFMLRPLFLFLSFV